MKKLLIIEDHIGLREAYNMLFVREGYEVEVAGDGEEGLAKVATGEYDVILLDMLMPVMDGISFLRKYQPVNHPNTKVIAFSNLQAPDTVKEAMELGVSKYITKSITPPRKMAEIVHDVIYDHELEQSQEKSEDAS